MRISFNQKALSAFKKLGAVVLITATIFFVACNQTGGTGGGGKPTPKPKHTIAFGVEGSAPNGTLKAKADGIAETSTSSITVEEGKTVTFTATANAGYNVKEWKVDGKPVAEAGTKTEYKLTVTKPATVKVSFEANGNPPTPTKYTVTLNQTANGKVTASPEIPEDKQVAEDTEITFTAKADDGYKVDKWMVTPKTVLQAGTGADGSETAKVKITANTTVSVSFIKKTYAITFSVEGGHGTLEAKVDGKEISSGDMVEHGKKVEFTPKAEKGYRLKNWTLDGKNIGGTAYFTLEVSKPATVTVSFESNGTTPTPMPQAVLTLDPDNLNIKIRVVTEDGSDVQVEGCNKTTLKSKDYTSLRANGTTVTLKGKITELDCDENKLTAVGVQGLTSLKELSCSKNQLTALNVQGLTALQKLKCQGNQLTSLDVKDLTTLQVIWCQDNQLTEINVSGLTALKELNCGNNKLTALEVQGLTALQELNCGNNKLTALEVQGLTALQNFSCSENQLTALGVQGLTALKWLACYNNQLSELNVQGLTALKRFDCYENKLTSLDVQGLTALQLLDCNSNQLTALNVQGLTALERINCSANKLTSLNVEGLTVLELLNCWGNKLNAEEMTKLLNALPARSETDYVKAYLYTEREGVEEGNCKDFTNPESLKKAFEEAKTNKHWMLKKRNASGYEENI